MFPISLSILFQGFFTALRLVAACQMGREPALTNILPMDPPPKFVGLETTKWTIEVYVGVSMCTDHTPYCRLLSVQCTILTLR